MKCTEKDIVMICKGYYDKEKHKDNISALTAYYNKHYDPVIPVVRLTYKHMYQLWFKYCVRMFLSPELINDFIYYVMEQKTLEERVLENAPTDFYEVLCLRIINWLMMLPSSEVDLTEYGDDNII